MILLKNLKERRGKQLWRKLILKKEKISASIDAFIVPNHNTKFSDYLCKDKRKTLEKLLQLNGMNANLNNQYMVRTLYSANEELGSRDLIDRGFKVKTDDRIYRFNMHDLDALPYCLLNGKKEGDVIKVTFPIKCTEYWLDYSCVSCGEETDWLFEAEMKLNKLSIFGPFYDANYPII